MLSTKGEESVNNENNFEEKLFPVINTPASKLLLLLKIK
jgi:hypothetical protein